MISQFSGDHSSIAKPWTKRQSLSWTIWMIAMAIVLMTYGTRLLGMVSTFHFLERNHMEVALRIDAALSGVEHGGRKDGESRIEEVVKMLYAARDLTVRAGEETLGFEKTLLTWLGFGQLIDLPAKNIADLDCMLGIITSDSIGQGKMQPELASALRPAMDEVMKNSSDFAPLTFKAGHFIKSGVAVLSLICALALAVAGVLLWRRQQLYIRQQAELAKQQQLAASVFLASTNAVMLTTPGGEIISVNPAFEAITGYAEGEVKGGSPYFLSSGLQSEAIYREMVETLAATGHWQGEIVNRRKNGETYTGLLTINAVVDESGALTHYVGVTTDISERKRYETELLAAKELAEAGALAKTIFLATMSHELRTPLNGVLGMVELLLRGDLSDRQRRQLSIVKSSADTLLSLLNEILDYSRIEIQGVAVEAKPYEPVRLIGDIVGLFAPHAEAKTLSLGEEIMPQLPGKLIGDALRLRQILTNLVANAIRFTRRGSIVVKAWCEPMVDGDVMLCLAVRDTGIGIHADKQEQIFHAFVQADGSHSRNFGGAGLGLAICRRLAHAMHGTLVLESSSAAGSCFTLRVPQRLCVDGDKGS